MGQDPERPPTTRKSAWLKSILGQWVNHTRPKRPLGRMGRVFFTYAGNARTHMRGNEAGNMRPRRPKDAGVGYRCFGISVQLGSSSVGERNLRLR